MATYDGKADFAKVDIDQLSDLAFEFNVNFDFFIHIKKLIID